MACDPTKIKLGPAHKHSSPTISCRFDPTGQYVFFGAEDSRVWRWKWQADEKTELAGHDSWVRGLAFDSAGEILVSGGYDGRIIWWPAGVETPQPLRTLDAHQGWVRAVAVSPDDQWLASVGNDRTVQIRSMADGELVRSMGGHESHVYNVAFHPDGERLVSGDLKGRLIEWRIEDGSKLRELTLKSLNKYDKTFKADIGGTRAMTFRADGKQLACSGITNVTNAFAGVGNPIVEVVDWESGKPLMQHLSKKKLRGVGWAAEFHPDGYLIGASGGGGGGFILFWKPDAKDEFHQFKLPNTTRDMDLHPDACHLATAHYDGHVRVLEMPAASS